MECSDLNSGELHTLKTHETQRIDVTVLRLLRLRDAEQQLFQLRDTVVMSHRGNR